MMVSISTIFGQSPGPQQGVTATLDSSGKFADSLAGVQVFFNGIAAPMIYAQLQELKAIVPFEVASAKTVDIQVDNNGLKSNINTLSVAATFPGILGIVNQDGNLNSNEFAPQGSIISVYATGGGPNDSRRNRWSSGHRPTSSSAGSGGGFPSIPDGRQSNVGHLAAGAVRWSRPHRGSRSDGGERSNSRIPRFREQLVGSADHPRPPRRRRRGV